MPKTRDHFWVMVWQERVSLIFMLTNTVENGKIKCDVYWPETEALKVGNLEIDMISKEEEYEDKMNIRKFRITDLVTKEERTIE